MAPAAHFEIEFIKNPGFLPPTDNGNFPQIVPTIIVGKKLVDEAVGGDLALP